MTTLTYLVRPSTLLWRLPILLSGWRIVCPSGGAMASNSLPPLGDCRDGCHRTPPPRVSAPRRGRGVLPGAGCSQQTVCAVPLPRASTVSQSIFRCHTRHLQTASPRPPSAHPPARPSLTARPPLTRSPRRPTLGHLGLRANAPSAGTGAGTTHEHHPPHSPRPLLLGEALSPQDHQPPPPPTRVALWAGSAASRVRCRGNSGGRRSPTAVTPVVPASPTAGGTRRDTDAVAARLVVSALDVGIGPRRRPPPRLVSCPHPLPPAYPPLALLSRRPTPPPPPSPRFLWPVRTTAVCRPPGPAVVYVSSLPSPPTTAARRAHGCDGGDGDGDSNGDGRPRRQGR